MGGWLLADMLAGSKGTTVQDQTFWFAAVVADNPPLFNRCLLLVIFS